MKHQALVKKLHSPTNMLQAYISIMKETECLHINAVMIFSLDLLCLWETFSSSTFPPQVSPIGVIHLSQTDLGAVF